MPQCACASKGIHYYGESSRCERRKVSERRGIRERERQKEKEGGKEDRKEKRRALVM